MPHYLAEVRERVGPPEPHGYVTTDRYVVQAEDVQMVKWWYHVTMHEAGYNHVEDPEVDGTNHEFEHPDVNTNSELSAIRALDPTEAEIVGRHIPAEAVVRAPSGVSIETGLVAESELSIALPSN